MRTAIICVIIVLISIAVFGIFYKPPMQTGITKPMLESMGDMLPSLLFTAWIIFLCMIGFDDIRNKGKSEENK
jgi:amino acid transporter